MHRLHIGNNRRSDIRKPRDFALPRYIDAELPILARTENCGREKNPRLVLRIHIHLGGNRHAILRAGSSDNASKPKERRLRKRPKERETFLDEATLFLPTLRGQSWTPVQARAIVVGQSFLPCNILPKIIRIISG